jgi:hypothetical protein
LCELGIATLPVLSKCDKLSKGNRQRQAAAFCRAFAFAVRPVLYSTQLHDSREAFWKAFDVWAARLQKK